jgi:Uma2 family endonuclease
LFVGLLGNHVEEKELGGEVTGANGTFKLTAYDTSVPNCAYISEEKTNALPPETVFYPFAPDLAVEIRSALQSKRYMDELAVMYLNAGSKLVWMVDPQALTIEVYRANGTRTLLRHDAYLSGETLLPGFRVSLKKVFSVVEKLNPMTPP